MNNKKDKKSIISLPLGMCFGVAFGTTVGSVTGNIGFWLPIGLCAGMLFGVVFMNKGSNDGDDTQERDGKK